MKGQARILILLFQIVRNYIHTYIYNVCVCWPKFNGLHFIERFTNPVTSQGVTVDACYVGMKL